MWYVSIHKLGNALICFLAENIDTALTSVLLFGEYENLSSLSEVRVELILVCHRQFQEELQFRRMLLK